MEKYKLYKGEIELCFEPATHTYTVNNEIVYGVTSIVEVLNKPAVLYWAVNKTIEYLDANLQVGLVIDEVNKKAILDEAKYAHRRHLKKAGDIGTAIHEWLEKYIKATINKEPLPDKPVNKEMKKSIEAFLNWTKKHKIKWLSSERKVYSRKYKYAGTLDAEAQINGHLAIVDFKTSNGFYPEYFLQTSAYVKALEEETGNKYHYTVIVRIPKNGNELTYVKNENIDLYFRSFLGCLENYKRIRWEKSKEIEERRINGT
ncbi:MAG: hypothetical protein DRP08_03965 [Candidatus Aenigmatarchaeota archaeon]|nr:MAG: hypothetical protein DRP08_03965 [Candidatus Aenigmarchaeota archaeon]